MKYLLAFWAVFLCCACQGEDSGTHRLRGERYASAPPSARIEARPTGPSTEEISNKTQIIVLGTGTPIPDAYRAGPSIALIYRGEAYIFDAGTGASRQATRARYKYDIPALYPSEIKSVFISHLHSDHILDLPDFIYALWWRRRAGLTIYGPLGIERTIQGIGDMLSYDTQVRLGGRQPTPNPRGYIPTVVTLQPGIVHQADGLTIEAFQVPHGDIRPAFGFKIITPDLSAIISGDTAFSEVLQQKARGVDYLIHEVVSAAGLGKRSPFWQNYHTQSHTIAARVGEIAQAAGVKTLVLYHGLFFGADEDTVVREASGTFDGPVILARDLDLFQ